MASGLQCPGCGHVHPAALPEIARGDKTFRCYGCYRTLSIPEGWTGRPASRAAPSKPAPTPDAPPGAGLRDARAARLAGRRGTRPEPDVGDPTQMVPLPQPAPAPDPPVARGPSGRPLPDWAAAREAENWAAGRDTREWGREWPVGGAWPDQPTGREIPGGEIAGRESSGGDAADWGPDAAGSPAPNWPAAGATGTWAAAAGTAAPGSAGVAGVRTAAGGSTGGLAGTRPGAIGGTGGLSGARSSTATSAAGPLGWAVPRRTSRPVPPLLRALVWAGSFTLSLLVTAYVLRKLDILDVNTVIDLFAGSGPGRFGILVVMLPLWALLSASIAHFSIEALARRRRSRPSTRRTPSETAAP